MAKRVGLTKRKRFDAFKRDQFRCQYCGNSPPTVVLEIDHIVPVANGGDDSDDNLVTSCFDCNRGKSDRSLSEVPPNIAAKLREQKELAVQLKEYNRFLLKRRQEENESIDDLEKHWLRKIYEEADRWRLTDASRTSLRTFLQRLPFQEIWDAMDLAHSRFPMPDGVNDRTWKYFCGVCWRKIKGDGRG